VKIANKFPKASASVLVLTFFVIPPALFARCPIPANGTLEVVAPAGNLIIDTSGTDSVDWDVTGNQITAKQSCNGSVVHIEGTASGGAVRPIPDWHIKVPRTVVLDLVTHAGSITIGDSDRAINARTGGGAVFVGNVNGELSIMSRAGNIQAGDIGGNADIRSSEGGNIVLGNVKGVVTPWTLAGDITIVSARKIADAFTGGGNMLIKQVFTSFKGKSAVGNIRIEEAGSSVDASTGSGSIYLKLVPGRQSRELHVNLEAGTGDIQLWLPTGMKADIQATAQGSQIHSDFPMVAQAQRGGFRGLPSNSDPGIKVPPGMTFAAPPSSFQMTETGQRNGGGNPIHLRTTVGNVEIKLFN
jgi:hypothetical protein